MYLNVVIFVIGGMLTTLCLKWVHENTNFHISVTRNKINIKIGKYFQHSVNISIQASFWFLMYTLFCEI